MSAAPTGMRGSERTTTTPVGLSRFLVAHRGHGGFETLRDNSLVTVVCSGCEASFSYLKPPEEEETPADIDAALAWITRGGRGGSGNGTRTAASPLRAPERRAEPDAPQSPPKRAPSSPGKAPFQPQDNGVNGNETTASALVRLQADGIVTSLTAQ